MTLSFVIVLKSYGTLNLKIGLPFEVGLKTKIDFLFYRYTVKNDEGV
jgi:hypothetical protein